MKTVYLIAMVGVVACGATDVEDAETAVQGAAGEELGTLEQPLSTESYTVSWVDKTSTRITMGVTPIHVADSGGPVEDIVIKKDTMSAYPDRSGIEDPEDARAKINLRSSTFATASSQIVAQSRLSYVSDKTTMEQLSSFSWVP